MPGWSSAGMDVLSKSSKARLEVPLAAMSQSSPASRTIDPNAK